MGGSGGGQGDEQVLIYIGVGDSGGGLGDEQVLIYMGVGGQGDEQVLIYMGVDGQGDEQVLIYMGVGGGGNGGGLGENSCSNEGTVFCSHRKFNLNTGCRRDGIIRLIYNKVHVDKIIFAGWRIK